MIAFDGLMPGYLLNKLTDVFEGIVGANNTFSVKVTGVAGVPSYGR
ncbi:hypothetical protein [Pseudomonas fluorescens]